MAQIEGFRIRNYKVLKDITLGKSWNNQCDPLTKLTALIGKNGTGKSSIFEAFGFISDCLKNGAEEACDKRGGFEKIFSKGQDVTEGMNFEICYRDNPDASPVTYEFSITTDEKKRPFVSAERLRQRVDYSTNAEGSSSFLILNNGVGVAWKGEAAGRLNNDDDSTLLAFIDQIEKGSNIKEAKDAEVVRLDDNRHLALATLGSLKQHPRVAKLRKFIENWYLNYFSPDSARSLPAVGCQKHLNARGDNLANVVQYMQREHGDRFAKVLDNISKKIPGIEKIDTRVSPDGRLLLEFYAQGFSDPFYAQQISDGTLKFFTYMLLIEDPEPHSLICIEEPENGLYHKLLDLLGHEFRNYASDAKEDSQVFITTHQPFLVNVLEPKEVWILEKQPDGFSKIFRVSDNELANNMTEAGLQLGELWCSDYLGEE
ncbi:MAG: AAA family ATPase [Succinivibrionaceae bacterium]|nr:AAA family ATPase [Succinivibrionaceae bacterium]